MAFPAAAVLAFEAAVLALVAAGLPEFFLPMVVDGQGVVENLEEGNLSRKALARG